jgi:hypothetical protein
MFAQDEQKVFNEFSNIMSRRRTNRFGKILALAGAGV